ncbi:MAG UNVERIFIED_CONTAM: hypothetical protein LVR18_44775 [Planctomycetaceae bacterium]
MEAHAGEGDQRSCRRLIVVEFFSPDAKERDSSHGSDMETPSPRRTVRAGREMREWCALDLSFQLSFIDINPLSNALLPFSYKSFAIYASPLGRIAADRPAMRGSADQDRFI